MKKRITAVSVFTVLVLSSFAYDLTPEQIAKDTVKSFFTCFENVFNANGNNISTNGEFDNLADVVKDTEIKMPNILSPNSGEDGAWHILTEFSKEVAANSVSKFEYKILNDCSCPLKESDFNNKTGECTYINAGVQISINDRPQTIYFVVHWSEKKITYISDKKQTPNTINIKHEYKTSVDDLRMLAAKYYTNGNYTEAYKKYLEIINQKYDGDAYYRLAVMTYYEDGCKDIFKVKGGKKLWDSKLDEYLNGAIKYGNSEISRKARNMKYNIQ